MLQNIIDYCKNPQYNIEMKSISFKGFMKLYIVCQLCVFAFAIPAGIVVSLTKVTSTLNDESIELIILGILLIPLVEEILFRLLLRPSKAYIILFVGLFLFCTIGMLIQQKYYAIYFALPALSLILLLILITKRNPGFFQKNFRWIFYLSVLGFGLLHISNFEGIKLSIIALTPLLVLPQLLMGFALSYTRMLHGFRYAVLLHMCINTFAFMPTLLKITLNYFS